MGRYINHADIVNHYGSVNKRGADEVNSAFIGRVENWIDGRLATHYTVPFSSNNETVKLLCIDEAYYRLNTGKLKGAKEIHQRVLDEIDALKNGTAYMTAVSSGDTTIIKPSATTAYSTTEDEHSSFGMLDEKLMSVDSDTLIKEYGERGMSY